MSKHLIRYSHRVMMDFNNPKKYPLLEIDTKEYLLKRLHFRTWKLHQTMGRPILILRNPPEKN